MLEIRPNCENCAKPLPNNSEEATICSFECTFCIDCVTHLLHNVCPNCGGGFAKRPTRPISLLGKHPVSDKIILHPVDKERFKKMLDKYKVIKPNEDKTSRTTPKKLLFQISDYGKTNSNTDIISRTV